MTNKPHITNAHIYNDVNYRFLDGDSESRKLVIERTQEIPSDFLDTLRDHRLASSNSPAREMHRVASIPVAVVEQWKREGFDIQRESAKAILSRLRSSDMGAFITTNKRI